jgi:hypothetical protein
MKTWRWAFPLGVFSFVGLGFWFGRPEPIATEDFSFDSPTPEALPPLDPEPEGQEVTGRVLDVDGTPVEDVLVAIWPESAGAGRPLSWDYSDAAGTFRLQHLTGGPHRVLLSAARKPPSSLRITVPVEGDVEWRLAATPEPMPELPPIRWRTFTGRIARVPGALSTIEGLEVLVRPAEDLPELSGAARRRTITDVEGRFAFDRLVAAPHVIEVLPQWARSGSWPVLGRFDVPIETPEEVEFLLAVGSVEGRLQESSGRPLEGALVTLTRPDATDALGAAQTWPPEVTNFRGSFRFEMLPPGRYQLRLRAGSASRELSVTVEAQRHQVLDLEPMDPGERR